MSKLFGNWTNLENFRFWSNKIKKILKFTILLNLKNSKNFPNSIKFSNLTHLIKITNLIIVKIFQFTWKFFARQDKESRKRNILNRTEALYNVAFCMPTQMRFVLLQLVHLRDVSSKFACLYTRLPNQAECRNSERTREQPM